MIHTEKILAYLADIAPGRVGQTEVVELRGWLAGCWETLSGSDAGGMKADKLHRDLEEMEWNPPILRFKIVRHGGVREGSSRAGLQFWEVDLKRGTATIVRLGHRQMRPADAPMNVKAIATEIATVVIGNVEDVRVERRGNTVAILTAKIIPATNRQTTAVRRRRFAEELAKQLSAHGWRRKSRGGPVVFEGPLAA